MIKVLTLALALSAPLVLSACNTATYNNTTDSYSSSSAMMNNMYPTSSDDSVMTGTGSMMNSDTNSGSMMDNSSAYNPEDDARD